MSENQEFRKVYKKIQKDKDILWEEIHFIDIKRGDVFKAFEPDGTPVENEQGDIEFIAERNAIIDPITNITSIVHYSGKYCETLIPDKSVRCHDNIHEYCKNGGVCNEHSTTTDINVNPCICPNEYTGKHCEYSVHTIPECDLP